MSDALELAEALENIGQDVLSVAELRFLTDAAEMLRAQAQELVEARKALAPFAAEGADYDERWGDDMVVPLFSFTYGDLRRAQRLHDLLQKKAT